ncbi:FtsX-like permease family protein [Demequina sp. B12]|uniref:ABC transporter permease n=1 Tax=Demequina sp. B12 TaxID=2992757 RepID=UPI00237A68B5|nr:FtsX-like permease family protein [Demequina sp. B12]MDE0572406.1 FtsX-like permease family protein [Demequina sp. B12]
MFRLAVKSVRHNPKRLLLTAFAVALGVSLVAATQIFTNSLSSGFSDLFDDIYAGTDVIVEADPDAQSETEQNDDPFAISDGIFTADDVTAVGNVEGVSIAAGGIQVMGAVLGPDYAEDAVGSDPLTAGGTGPSQIFNWYGEPAVDQSTVVDGRGVEADGEIVLDIDAVENLGYAIGDEVAIATDSGVETFELVGTVRFGENNNLQGATLAYISDAEAHRLADDPNYASISVIADEGANLDRVVTRIGDVLPEGTRAITGEDKAAEQTEALDDVLQYVDIFAIAFGLIALFVGAYIIVNTFRIIVTQRTREFGLMRAIGVTGKQIRSMILLEALVIAIAASTLGIIMGYLLALAFAGLVTMMSGDIFGTLTLPLDAVLWSYALGTAVTLIAAFMPAIHASRIAPMEALRESATSGKKPLKVRNIVGAAMFLVGAGLVTVGLYSDFDRPYIWVGAGAVTLVIGATLLSAQILSPLAGLMRPALTRMFRVDGKLAANNIQREPRRSSNTAAALMIGVMLLALVATFTESLKTVVTAEFATTKADFFVSGAQGAVPAGAIDIVESLDGVEAISSIGFDNAQYDGVTYSVAMLEPETAGLMFEYQSEPAVEDLGTGEVYIAPTIADLGVNVGDEITLTGSEGDVTLEVTGELGRSADGDFWVDFATGEDLMGEVQVVQTMVLLDDSIVADDADNADNATTISEQQTILEEALAEDFPLIFVAQPGQLEQLANMFIDLLLGVISALLGSALVIALLGVANTLLLSVTERTREIGLLRAVGLKRSAVWRMITVESMVMAVFGTILGMVLGVALGSALVLSLADFGFDGVTIPWIWLIVYTVLAAIAGVLAAIWPAWRASRLDILQAIAADG